MANKLERYRGKRNPARTNEPFGAEPLRSGPRTRNGRYVVHLHDATRQHYDLRIEVGGVLKSFAIPKGPSLRVADKRLAVHTEDHPIDYLDFEAVIPEGNYGAGPMILWDLGVIHYLETDAETGFDKGKLDFTLQGFKLRGRFALVETGRRRGKSDGKRQWLLLKKPDAYASDERDLLRDEARSVLSGLRVDELPHAAALAAEVEAHARALGVRAAAPNAKDITPMRCTERDGKLDDPRCLYELKLDGVRIVAERSGQHVALRYRTGRNATTSYPEIARALRALAAQQVILDGEIVAFDDSGRPSFARLGQRIHAHGAADVRAAARQAPVAYLAFDLLAVGGLDLRALPLHARKVLLGELLRGKGFIRLLDHVEGDGKALLAFCEAQGLEGVIGKRADSRYVAGPERSAHWFKVKRVLHDDFVVVGYTLGSGNRKALGALELGSYVEGELRTRGRVGSGFDATALHALRRELDARVQPQCAARGELQPAAHGRVFVAPELVVSVEHAGFTPDGRLRHPVFRSLRDDVTPDQCTAAPHDEREAALVEAPPPAGAAGSARSARAGVHITNPDKIFWPNEGITKGELCEYYANIADVLLPYLHNRPVLMVRYPDGIEGKHFFQWNAPAGTPDWIRTRTMRSDDHARELVFFQVDDLDTLLYIANLGCIPLHVLAARFQDLERCDFLTVDFDLGEAPLGHAITLARSLHELLDELGLPSFPKTSGQTGLHVLVPMAGAPFELAKTFATLLGRMLQRRHPDISTMERLRQNRPNAVYIDTGQTGRSRAIVAPYSVRAYPGATVSTPLRWDEVGAGLSPARFDLASVPDRVAEHGDPMRELLSARPDLDHAIAKLGSMLER